MMDHAIRDRSSALSIKNHKHAVCYYTSENRSILTLFALELKKENLAGKDFLKISAVFNVFEDKKDNFVKIIESLDQNFKSGMSVEYSTESFKNALKPHSIYKNSKEFSSLLDDKNFIKVEKSDDHHFPQIYYWDFGFGENYILKVGKKDKNKLYDWEQVIEMFTLPKQLNPDSDEIDLCHFFKNHNNRYNKLNEFRFAVVFKMIKTNRQSQSLNY